MVESNPLTARKLQKINNSFSLNIPMIWVKRRGLDKGADFLIWTDEEDRLVLEPAGAEDD